MSLKGMLLGRQAYKAHGNADYETAMKLYEQAYDEGMKDPRFILGYTVLLLRDEQYAKAREILVALQNNPALTPALKSQLYVNYAAAVYRMGEIDKGIRLLERQHKQGPTGLIYQTLGCLYVEKYDIENTPDFDALEKAAAERAEEMPPEPEEPVVEKFPSLTPAGETEKPSLRRQWQDGIDRAEAFILESVDYDEEDSVVLDNYAQFLYRVKGDKEAAKEWFDKAIKEKDSQIDTLWFLSRYDLEKGDRKAALEKVEKLAAGRFSPLNHVTREMAQAELERLR
ncbi:MAG: tetratricopeptide repeat protein [Clostridia bacterium]|nr:tetratricopeptide repeat protein [Clostridia bacterium]MBR4459786.1 tetratricopeptide repeat protein [Clostridia bacterium]